LAKDFMLMPAHLEHLSKMCTNMRKETIYRLLPSVKGGETAEAYCMLLFGSVGEFLQMHKTVKVFIDFNIENPTGHYKLHLESPTDHAIAVKLLLLDRWEVVLDRRQGRADASQRGNKSHFRNEEHADRPLHLDVDSISDWNLPECDMLEFDYVSSKRTPIHAGTLSCRAFSNLLVSLFDAQCAHESKVDVLHMLSHLIYLTSGQLREMMMAFKSETHRADVFVTFFLRVVDMWNSKKFRVRFSDEAEIRNLQSRLGHVIIFPFVQPENLCIKVDFAKFDERLCCNMLLCIGGKEGAGNIRDPVFYDGNGNLDPLALGIPRSWEIMSSMPQAGIFSCRYVCSPENRRFKDRTALAEKSSYFSMDVAETEVDWWTGLEEVPPDVLDLLEFLIGNFDDVYQAFHKIDGEGGNGVITLKEFVEGLAEINCTKYKGKGEKERVDAVFRYLDPGGEGSVSEEEWGVLDQLWKEYQLCISEFVWFVQRTFGDDLMVSWEYLDEDGSGEVTLEEFTEAVEALGFYGPARCIFGLIDNSDDGSISMDEFEVLNAYKLQSTQAAAGRKRGTVWK